MNTTIHSMKAILLTATLFGMARTAVAAPVEALPGFDRYVQQVRAEFDNVGVAVAVVHGDKVLMARGFGVREAGKAAPVDAGTLFQIGSTSKAFTCAALAVLVDEGKIRWDDPVVKYLPALRLQDPYITRHLTIRDAVTHRSGIPDNYYPYMAIMDEQQVIGQLRDLPAQSEFRDSFHYNNLMYAVAGKVLEAASGMSWNEFMKRRVFEPLQMRRSGTSAYQFWDKQYVAPTFYGSIAGGRTSFDRARDANVAMPHGLDERGAAMVLPWVTFDNAAPAGAVVSNATDMAHWLIMQVDEGHFGGNQVLQKETVRELHTTRNIMNMSDARQYPLERVEGYALGWFKGDYQSQVYLAHGGGMLGFPAYMAIMPDQKIGVAVLSNGPSRIIDDYRFHRAIAFGALDRLLGAPAHDWGKDFLARMQADGREAQRKERELQQARLQNAPASLPLEGFVGTYEDRRLHSGPVVVRVENGGLFLSFGEGALSGRMEHWHGNVFRLRTNAGGYEYIGPEFTAFTLDPAGKVVSMSLTSPYFSFVLDRTGP